MSDDRKGGTNDDTHFNFDLGIFFIFRIKGVI